MSTYHLLAFTAGLACASSTLGVAHARTPPRQPPPSAFESPEPEGEAILAAYPEGTYTFSGVSSTGERFRSQAKLSHDLPAPVTILHPSQDAQLGTDSLTIQRSAVTGIREYVIEFENESADPEQILKVNVPASQTSLEIPSSMLAPGSDYQVGVWTIGTNGNISVVETTFSTVD